MLNSKVLFSTLAIHMHAQQIALALHEQQWLKLWQTEGLDLFTSPAAIFLRKRLDKYAPKVGMTLSKRKLGITIPPFFIDNRWRWELARIGIKQLRKYPLWEDWLWEKSEYALDDKAAKRLQSDDFDVFIGTEFGSLKSIYAAKKYNKKSVLIFTSPHHATREKWLSPIYEEYAQWITPAQKILHAKSFERDRRRDEEAFAADFIHTSSTFTRNSLIEAGVAAEKIAVAPLGGPAVRLTIPQKTRKNTSLKVVFVGNIALHKGAHLLLEAWQKANIPGAELHLYGQQLLNDKYLAKLPGSIYFHGFVPQAALSDAYFNANILVFPTLCDGFGMVITEALAHGCPVITTSNAGGADYIQSGKNGFVIEPGSTDAIQERLEWCRDNFNELLAMRAEATRSAQHFSWEKFRAKFKQDMLGFLEY